MQVKKAFLVLVDISGYTKFIRLHKASLIHAEKIISELLESVIQCSRPPLVLNKLQIEAYTIQRLLGKKTKTYYDLPE